MKYYNQFLDLGCFRKKAVKQFIHNENSLFSTLARYQKRGLIEKVKGDYYVTMDIVNKTPLLSKYVIATKMDDSNYIAFHSAFAYYGYRNQVFNDLVFCSEKSMRDFMYDNIEYHAVKSKCALQIKSNYDGSKVTTLERTIVDCIDNINLGGGIEEVYKVLDCIHHINESNVIEILDFYNKKVLYQRVGYIVEQFKGNLNISEETLAYLHSKIDRSSCYLISSRKQGKTRYNAKWRISVPIYIDQIVNKGVINYEV